MTDATFTTISYDTDGAIATITMRRPDAANALNSAMIDEIDAAFDLAEGDDAVRVVILAAEGKHEGTAELWESYVSGTITEVRLPCDHAGMMRADILAQAWPAISAHLGLGEPDERAQRDRE